MKKIFLIFLLMLIGFGCCKESPTTPYIPPESKFIYVETKYERDFSDSDVCPPFYPGDPENVGVFLQGLTARNYEMNRKGEHSFDLEPKKVRVTYPPEKWGGDPRKVFVIDNLCFDMTPNCKADLRARFLWFNNVLMEKIHGECNKGGQYVLVRFDENGVPHEE